MVYQLLTHSHLQLKKVVKSPKDIINWLMLPYKPKTAGDNNPAAQGQVYLIGAGSGDPELLTLKAHRILQHADVILIDWLVNSAIAQYFPPNVDVIFVGKKQGQHSMPQEQIGRLMLQKALLGKTVVRLKGGDPSIFGRLSEETQILASHNIPFAIVPGVTAASACGAYTGITLTDRACSQSVQFVTAHFKDEEQQANWQPLASSEQTLVFYMGLSRVDNIAQQLIAHGMRVDMPIAVIDKGTLDQQQICCRTLDTMQASRDLAHFTGPALIIVGDVVKHRQQVNLEMLKTDYFAKAMELKHVAF